MVSPLVPSLITKALLQVAVAPSASLHCFSSPSLLSSFRIENSSLEDFKVVVAVVRVKIKTEGSPFSGWISKSLKTLQVEQQ